MEAAASYSNWLLSIPAGVVLLSWFDWAPRGFPFPGRAGFYWAGLLLAGAVAVALYRKTLRPARAVAADPRLRKPVVAAAMVVGAWALASVGASDRASALAETGRVLAVLIFLALTSSLAMVGGPVSERIAWVALSLIGIQAALLVAGLASDRLGAIVFERMGAHTHVGHLPRFMGLMQQPMECGSATLLIAGLLAGVPGRRLRLMAIGVATTIVIMTLSFATLVVPVAAIAALPWRRGLRALSITVFAIAAVAALWVNPTCIEVGGRAVLTREPLLTYYQSGLGPRYMPEHTLSALGFRITFFFTGYALLSARSVTCALEHPLGVGARNFVHSCPVWAMNTRGGWTDQRSAHSSYGALLAEGGLPATLATLALVTLLARRLRWRSGTQFEKGVLVAYLVAGFGGASPYQFAFAALLGTATELRSTYLPRRTGPTC